MTDLDAFYAGLVAEPQNDLRWLVMADWLEENGQPERAELVRIHRELLRTCVKPDEFPERPTLHARMMELMRAGVKPCVPERVVNLPGNVEMRLAFIPPGKFLMGSPETEAERNEDEFLHQVELTRGFWMGIHPVTQAQWLAVVGSNASRFKGEEMPVGRVRWQDAQEFCRTLKQKTMIELRLPTETEWEYAARGGTTTPFYWGDELNGTQANCDGNHPYGTKTTGLYRVTTTVVGSYVATSPHPWKLTDVHGNVCEWCTDLLDPTAEAEVTAPEKLTGALCRVYRGGSWYSTPRQCRSACRSGRGSGDIFSFLGFRLAADLSSLA